MSNIIYGNMVGGSAPLKTVILTDENGNEIVGVVVDQETVFTATDNDVRKGSTYASDGGVSTGTKIIPNYYTVAGVRKINSGNVFAIPIYNELPLYDYTEMQAIVCLYDTDNNNSLAAKMVSINDKVYNVNSTEEKSSVVKDDTSRKIMFNLVNEDEHAYLIRYFLYKEIY